MTRPSLTAVPAERSSLPRLEVRRRIVLGLLGAGCAVGLAAGVAWVAQPDPAPVSIPAHDDGAVSLATIVAEDFAAGRNSVIPAAEGVDTQFARSGALKGARVNYAGSVQHYLGDGTTPALVERVSFLVAYDGDDGATHVLKVSVAVRKVGDGWVLAAAPSVQPASLQASGSKGLDYSELYTQGGTPSELSAIPGWGSKVDAQVKEWARVFAAGGTADPDLFRITGDKNSQHTYDGLGGWTVQNVAIKSFAMGANSEARAGFGSTWLTVRVALVLVPPGANGPSLNTEYDLLLEPEMNPAQPPVTAWGPAGVGPTSALSDYGNTTNG